MSEVVSAGAVAVVGWWGFEAGAAPEVTRFNPALVTGVFTALAIVAVVGGWRRPTDPAPGRLFGAAVALSVSYFRFLQSSWLATLGAAVWLASAALVLVVFTEPARDRRRLPIRAWNIGLAVLAVATVLVSGPASSDTSVASRRAMSWTSFDAARDLIVRQPNPLAVVTSDRAVTALSTAWCLAVATVAVAVLRRLTGAAWRLVTLLAVAATLVLALPVRLDDDTFLLDRSFADLLVGVPMICAGLYAAWAVWVELITPRLTRPYALVIELDRESTVAATRLRLARALGDPSAAIVFAVDDGWVDESGRRLPDDRPDRRLVAVTRDAETLAAIDLDALTQVAPDLLAAAAASLVVSLEAQRLAAFAEAAAAEARRSAMRILDIDREAIEEITRQINAGPHRTLAEVDELLDVRPVPLAQIHDGLRLALEQIRAIAHHAVSQPVQQKRP